MQQAQKKRSGNIDKDSQAAKRSSKASIDDKMANREQNDVRDSKQSLQSARKKTQRPVAIATHKLTSAGRQCRTSSIPGTITIIPSSSNTSSKLDEVEMAAFQKWQRPQQRAW